ncbi:MAG: class I SAM-dependent methyltransferase [Chloroflexi bacterium]|nr:class I SAM-dependent methyltransferase [Chloroflexota bacterium]
MIPLSGEYYVECNEVFRRSTNQAEHMLAEMSPIAQGRSELRILSVGSGAGLFEMPMLQMLEGEIKRFVGIDLNEHACQVLRTKLHEQFSASLDFEVVNRSFQEYRTDRRFEIVLFNHSFEYLDGDRLSWIQKSRELLAEAGIVLIFSPNRGGINRFYDELFAPFLSEDLKPLLARTGINYSTTTIDAECDLSLLDGDEEDSNRIRLLSFLTQTDCRNLPPSTQREFAGYFLSLRKGETSMIPHPTTLFVL